MHWPARCSALVREMVVADDLAAWATGGEAVPEPQAATPSAEMTSAPAASRQCRPGPPRGEVMAQGLPPLR